MALKRHKTDYPGVFYREGTRIGGKGIEKIYYVVYKKNGKTLEEKAGRQYAEAMTPARASGIRSDLIEGKRLTRKEKRKQEKELKKSEDQKWTIGRLFDEYIKSRPKNKARATDKGRYEKYLKPKFDSLEPNEILPLDVDRLRINLLKNKSPQTVKHVLNLLTWVINFGVNNGLCSGLNFKIKKPSVNNIKTEDLTKKQLENLLKAIAEDTHEQAGKMMLTALYTGMRRGEMFKLKWEDIDFNRGFITIVDPKGGPNQKIPLNDAARSLFESINKTKSPYVFPGRGGIQRVDINKALNEIKAAAGLPKDFRPLHGLRHLFATTLANSGKVDMYTLQKLLTHKSPQMTQRYAHLRDEALKKASNLAGDLIEQAAIDRNLLIERS